MSWFEAMTRIFPSLSPGRAVAAATDRRGAGAPVRSSRAPVGVAAARAAPKRRRPASESEEDESCSDDGDSDDSVAAAAWRRRESAAERQRAHSNPFAHRAGAPDESISRKASSRAKSRSSSSGANNTASPSKAHAKNGKRAPAGGRRAAPSSSSSSSSADKPRGGPGRAPSLVISGTANSRSSSRPSSVASASASGASSTSSAGVSSGPVVSMVAQDDRATWSALVGQMHGVCNEAARRRAERLGGLGARFDEPLSRQYLVDRVTLDEPLRGFTAVDPARSPLLEHAPLPSSSPRKATTGQAARNAKQGRGSKSQSSSSSGGQSGGQSGPSLPLKSAQSFLAGSSNASGCQPLGGGRLRGFVTMTTFSTWQRSFRWDSRCPQAGITPLDRAKPSSSEINAAAAAAASASVGVSAAGGGAAAVDSSLARSVSAGSNSSSGSRRRSRSSSHNCSSASMPLMSPTKASVFQTRDDAAAALAPSLIPPSPPSWPSTDSGPLASALMRLATYDDTYRERVVWPEVAEISLCGALGCGGALVTAAIEHLKRASHPRPVHPKKTKGEGGKSGVVHPKKTTKANASQPHTNNVKKSKRATDRSSRSKNGRSRSSSSSNRGSSRKELKTRKNCRSSRSQKHAESEDGEDESEEDDEEQCDEEEEDEEEDQQEELAAEDNEGEDGSNTTRIRLKWGGYKAIVLQATEAAVPFYERHGFVRVGAVSRWHDRLDMPEVPHRHWTNRVEHDEPSYMMCLPLHPDLVAALTPTPTALTAWSALMPPYNAHHEQDQQEEGGGARLYSHGNGGGGGARLYSHGNGGGGGGGRINTKVTAQGRMPVANRSRRGNSRSNGNYKTNRRDQPSSWSEALWSAAAQFGGVLSAEDGDDSDDEDDDDDEDEEECSEYDDDGEDYSGSDEDDEDDDDDDDPREDEESVEPGVTLHALQERLAVRQGVNVLACDALHTATANGGGGFTFGDLMHASVKLAEEGGLDAPSSSPYASNHHNQPQQSLLPLSSSHSVTNFAASPQPSYSSTTTSSGRLPRSKSFSSVFAAAAAAAPAPTLPSPNSSRLQGKARTKAERAAGDVLDRCLGLASSQVLVVKLRAALTAWHTHGSSSGRHSGHGSSNRSSGPAKEALRDALELTSADGTRPTRRLLRVRLKLPKALTTAAEAAAAANDSENVEAAAVPPRKRPRRNSSSSSSDGNEEDAHLSLENSSSSSSSSSSPSSLPSATIRMVEELEGRVSAAIVSRAFHAKHLGMAWAVRSTTAGVAAAAVEDKGASPLKSKTNQNSDAKKKKVDPPVDESSSASSKSQVGFKIGSLFHGRGVGKSKRYYISKVKSGEFSEECSDDFFNGGLDSPATSPPRNALLDSPPAGAYKAVLSSSDFESAASTDTLILGSSASGSTSGNSNRHRSGSNQPQKGVQRGIVRVVVVGRGQNAFAAAQEDSACAEAKKKKKKAPSAVSYPPSSTTASVQWGAPVLRRLGLRATPEL